MLLLAAGCFGLAAVSGYLLATRWSELSRSDAVMVLALGLGFALAGLATLSVGRKADADTICLVDRGDSIEYIEEAEGRAVESVYFDKQELRSRWQSAAAPGGLLLLKTRDAEVLLGGDLSTGELVTLRQVLGGWLERAS